MKRKGPDFLKKLYCKCNKNNMMKAALIFLTFVAGLYLLNMYNQKRIEGFSNDDLSKLQWENIKEGSNDKMMVLAHWEKCGHCKNMMPEWKSFESEYQGETTVARIESNNIPDGMKEKYNISGYPTILLIDKNSGDVVNTFEGERNKEGFEKFANSE